MRCPHITQSPVIDRVFQTDEGVDSPHEREISVAVKFWMVSFQTSIAGLLDPVCPF